MDRETLQAEARECMHTPGPTGDAWFYIYELICQSQTSDLLLITRLQRAANNGQIITAKRTVYQEVADSLAGSRREPKKEGAR